MFSGELFWVLKYALVAPIANIDKIHKANSGLFILENSEIFTQFLSVISKLSGSYPTNLTTNLHLYYFCSTIKKTKEKIKHDLQPTDSTRKRGN